MNNISNTHNCYGCGVCAVMCPANIIDITLNANGFYEPSVVEPHKCTNCGLCLDVCAFHHKEPALAPSSVFQSFAAWSNDKRIQLKCSSGGVGFEIGKMLMNEGYKVCGVRYNPQIERAEHYIASTNEELIQSIGSKYIQSYTLDGFRNVNRKDKYLITGTPCQIDSFRRLIQKKKIEEHFILLDFFCHSVPSMWAWKYYLRLAEKKAGKIIYASWRNKQTGWHDSWSLVMELDGEKCGEKEDRHKNDNLSIRYKKGLLMSRKSQGDLFYKLFLGDYCCNPACKKDCKYKYDSSSADIRIGDLWGKTYSENEDGVSALVAFTPRGREVINRLKECVLVEHPFEVVAEGQMKKNVGKAVLAPLMMECLKRRVPLFLVNGVILTEKICHKLKSYFA